MEALELAQTSIRVPFLTDDHIAQAASRLRAEYLAAGCSTSVALNPENLIWDFLDGRDRLSLDTEVSLGTTSEGDQIAGTMSVLADGGLVRIDQAVVKSALYSFTLAHEVGHWVLHKSVIEAAHSQGNLFDTRPREWVTLHRDLSNGGGRRVAPEEWQANRFATHLLMPDNLVRQQFAARFGGRPASLQDTSGGFPLSPQGYATTRDYAVAIAGRMFSGMVSLSAEFGTSRLAMAIRLEELRLVRMEALSEGLGF